MSAPPRPGGAKTALPPRRPWTPRQLGVRIAAIVLAGLLVVLLHFTGTLDSLQRRFFPQPVNWNNDYAVVEHLRDEVTRNGLTHDAKDCLLFIINGDDPPEAQRIQVMEKHTGSCPGAHGQLPRLFTLKLDRTKGMVETDQGTPGAFHGLTPR